MSGAEFLGRLAADVLKRVICAGCTALIIVTVTNDPKLAFASAIVVSMCC